MWTFRDYKVSLSCWKKFGSRRRTLTIKKTDIRSVAFPIGIWIKMLAQGRRRCSLFSRVHRRLRKIVQILIFQGTEWLTTWFLDRDTFPLNDKWLHCSANTFISLSFAAFIFFTYVTLSCRHFLWCGTSKFL